MHDETALRTEIPERVQAFDVVIRCAKTSERRLPHTGHDTHTDGDIRTISNFHANLAIRRGDRSHDVGHHIHRTALHGTEKERLQFLAHLERIFPVICRAGAIL